MYKILEMKKPKSTLLKKAIKAQLPDDLNGPELSE